MTIQTGDHFPSVTLHRLTAEGKEEIETAAFMAGRTVALFSVPGAFTPTCSNVHLPGFVAQADALRDKGVDAIVCLSVNDAYVMRAWAQAHEAEGVITMFPDGNGKLTEALGLELDGTPFGLGHRGQRFAMVIRDGVVESLSVESGPGVNVSGAEACLASL